MSQQKVKENFEVIITDNSRLVLIRTSGFIKYGKEKTSMEDEGCA